MRQTGPSLGDDYDEEGRPFLPPAQLTRESMSLLIKQERDAKREAKRRMYASQMSWNIKYEEEEEYCTGVAQEP